MTRPPSGFRLTPGAGQLLLSGESGLTPTKHFPRHFLGFILTIALALPLLAACSDTSASFGKYYRGKTLDVNIVTLERADEIRYQWPNTADVKHWRLAPSEEELELVMVRVKVENHTATSAIVNIDSSAAELRDFFRGKYFPIDVNQRVEEVSAPENPGAERTIVFLWNATLTDGSTQAFDLAKDMGIDGWLVFEAPKETEFREFRWRAGDSLSIDF